MRDVIGELKALRLHGMAATWADLIEQNNADLDRSRWLIEQMLRAESTDRATLVSHQMNAAKFPCIDFRIRLRGLAGGLQAGCVTV